MEWLEQKAIVLEHVDWVRVRLGFRPRCEWVRERFGAYFQWDLSETEFRVIARHLHLCPQCAKAWRETEPLLEQLEVLSPIGRQHKSISSEQFMADMMARIDRYEAEQASKEQERRQGIRGWVTALRLPVRMPRLATALLLLLSVSALAYLGPQVWRQISERWVQKGTVTQSAKQVTINKATLCP